MSALLSSLLQGFVPFAFGCLVTWFYLTRVRLPKESYSDIIKSVREIEELAARYWAIEYAIENSSDLALMEVKLKSAMQHLSLRIARYKQKYIGFRFRSLRPLIQFRRQVSSAPFEQIGRSKDLARIAGVRQSANDLVDAIEAAWGYI